MDQVHARVVEWVFREVIAPSAPEQQLAESLLWRGLLAERHGAVIQLHQGSRVADKAEDEILERIGIGLSPLDSDEYRASMIAYQPDWHCDSATPDVTDWAYAVFGQSPTLPQSILAIPSPCGMTAVGATYGGWKSFSRRRRGYSLSAFELDLGVSLLVRVLNAYGVSTRISGHGHEAEGMRLCIEFDGAYAFEIGRALLQYLGSIGSASVSQEWESVESFECRWPSERGLAALVEIQNQARALLDVRFNETVLLCKSLAVHSASQQESRPPPTLVREHFVATLHAQEAKPRPWVGAATVR